MAFHQEYMGYEAGPAARYEHGSGEQEIGHGIRLIYAMVEEITKDPRIFVSAASPPTATA